MYFSSYLSDDCFSIIPQYSGMYNRKPKVLSMPAWVRTEPGRAASGLGIGLQHGSEAPRPPADEIGLYHAFQPRVKGKPLRTDRATDEPDGRYKDDARLPAFSTRTVQRDANAYADFCAADMCAANCVLNDGTKRYVHFIDQRAALYAGTFPVFDGPAVVADFRQRQRRPAGSRKFP